jgi:outer membrane protein assembly factor BamB
MILKEEKRYDIKKRKKGMILKILKFKFLKFIVLSLFILIIVMPIDAQLMNSPMPKFHTDLNNTGRSAYISGITATLKWSLLYPQVINVAPLVDSNGIIYTVDQGGDIEATYPNGTQKYRVNVGSEFDRTGLIDDNGTIYVGSSGDFKVFAIYSENGSVKWTFNTGDVVFSEPTLKDGILYIGSRDDKLYAIYANNGTEKWHFTSGGPIGTGVLIDSNNIVYFGTISGDNTLYAVYANNGTEKWHYTTGNWVESTPSVDTNGIIYFGSDDNKVYALYQNGTQKWNFTTGASIGLPSPAIGSDGTIYIGSSDGIFYALYPNGTQKWNFLTGSVIGSGNNGIIGTSAIIDNNGKIVFGSNPIKFDVSGSRYYVLDSNGNLVWTFITINNAINLYAHGAIVTDGTLYLADTDGNLYAFKDPVFPPGIISFSNTKTNNASLTINLTTSQNIKFNATTNQTVNWTWTKDGVSTIHNTSNINDSIIYLFSTAGIHTINASGTNINGTSNTVSWTINFTCPAGWTGISTCNPPPYNNNGFNVLNFDFFGNGFNLVQFGWISLLGGIVFPDNTSQTSAGIGNTNYHPSINYIIDGQSLPINAGMKASNISLGFNGTIIRASMVADKVGNATVQILDNGTDISNGGIILSNSNSTTDTTLTGWTKTVTAYTTNLQYNVISADTITNLNIKLFFNVTS